MGSLVLLLLLLLLLMVLLLLLLSLLLLFSTCFLLRILLLLLRLLLETIGDYTYVYGSLPFVSLNYTVPCRAQRSLHVFVGFGLCNVRDQVCVVCGL